MVTQIGQAPDATSFLSTSAVLVGVFVTVVGTALAQLLLVSDDQSRTGWGRRAKFAVMAIIVAIDTFGVGFPLVVLYMNTVGEVSSALLRTVLVSTIVVVTLNVLLPVYAAYALRSFRYWAEFNELYKMSEEDATTRFRELLITRGRLNAQEFDDAYSTIKQGLRVEGPPAARLAKAMLRAVILGRDGVFGITLGRTVAYYLMKVFMRRAFRDGDFTFHPDGDTLEDEEDDFPTGQADKRGVVASVRTRAPSDQDGSSRQPG